MTGGLGDNAIWNFFAGGFGGEASAETVAGVATNAGDVLLDDSGDGSPGHARSLADGPSFVHRYEDWAFGDVGEFEPLASGDHGARFVVLAVAHFNVLAFALLIGFRSCLVDDEPLGVIKPDLH